jgi:hypothetical protein
MEFIAEIVDTQRGTETEVWSQGEISSATHRAAVATGCATNLYRLGVYAEILLTTVYFLRNAFADLLTQVTCCLAAVIELTAGYEIGNPLTAVIQLMLKQPVLAVNSFSLCGKRQGNHLKVRELGNNTSTRYVPFSFTRFSENCLHISRILTNFAYKLHIA